MQQNRQQFKVKGDALIEKGNKKAKGSFFGNIFKRREERAETALECYKDAAGQYKMAQEWELAADAYIKAVHCDLAVQGGEAGDLYQDAASMLKKAKNVEYIQYLNKAVEILCSENRIGQGAKLKKQIGEDYESDMEYDLAIDAFQESADLFYSEKDYTSDYLSMRLKVANLSIHKKDVNYVECIKIYDEVSSSYLKNSLQAHSAKNLFFQSVLLYLANDDAVGAQIALEKYQDQLPSFGNTRQCKFLAAIITAVNENKVEDFSTECYEHNKIIPLDNWQTSILSKIKEKINPGSTNQNIVQEEQPQQQQQQQQQSNIPTSGVDVL